MHSHFSWVVGLSLAAASGLGLAQSSSVVYGVVDTGIQHVTNVGAEGRSHTGMLVNTGSMSTRLGFRGTEDLGNGLKALYTLEAGISPATGGLGQGGRLFGRQAYVGLAGPWGTLTLGRQYTMLAWSGIDADILGANVFGIAALDSYIANARADNSISYRGTFSGLTLGATYSFGRDTVNAGNPGGTNCPGVTATDSQACQERSAMVKYDTSTWGAALAVDEIRGGPGAFGGLSSGSMRDRHISANGYVKLGALKLGAGVHRRDNDANVATPQSDLGYFAAAYTVSPQIVIDGQVFHLKFKDSANKATLAALRGTYNLSQRTALYASVGHISNDGTLALSVSAGQGGLNPAAGSSQSGMAVGIRHSF